MYCSTEGKSFVEINDESVCGFLRGGKSSAFERFEIYAIPIPIPNANEYNRTIASR